MAKAGLTQARVVEEAEQLVDEIGLARLTLAALAARLGIRQPSLYKHVDGAEGLLRLIAIRAKIELADTLRRATVGRARDDAITSMSVAYRQWAGEHPGRYLAAQRAPVAGDAEDEAASKVAVEVCAAVLTGYHLSGDSVIDAIRALRSTLHGFVALEAAGGFGMPVDVSRSFERTVRGLRIALASWDRDDAEQATQHDHES